VIVLFSEKFCTRMADYLKTSETNTIFTEDLKSMVYIAETDSELNISLQMIRRSVLVNVTLHDYWLLVLLRLSCGIKTRDFSQYWIESKSRLPQIVNHLRSVDGLFGRFHAQNSDVRFSNFIFGPLVMRLLHVLNKPDIAYEVFMDKVCLTLFCT